MLSKSAQRKRAYQFICKKSKELKSKFSYGIDKITDENDIVSLADLEKLSRGIIDPPDEMISILRKLLRPVSNESEIERYLIKPFKTFKDSI